MLDTDVEVDASEIRELVRRGTKTIVRAIHMVALALRDDHIPEEAPKGETGALGEDWHLKQVDALTWTLSPGKRAFYAHIVARGSKAHGPRKARAMRIGESRFVAWVSGVPANPFDERAKRSADARAQHYLDEALRREGL